MRGRRSARGGHSSAACLLFSFFLSPSEAAALPPCPLSVRSGGALTLPPQSSPAQQAPVAVAASPRASATAAALVVSSALMR